MSLYLTSTVDAVVDAIARNEAGIRNLRERAFEWAKERGSDTVMMNGFGGGTWVTGLPEAPEGFGQWTKPKNGSSHPYRTNVDEAKALNALTFRAEPIPGLPATVRSKSASDGRRYVMYPTPFVQDGRAWVIYSHQPEEPASEIFGEEWQECLASEFHAAREAREAAFRATPPGSEADRG